MTRQDPRVTRTRRAIITAARGILLDGDLDHLTVSDIASRAGYSRRAVYANFVDLAGVVRATALDALQLEGDGAAAESTPLDADELRRRILLVLERIDDDRPLLLAIAELPHRSALTDVVDQVISEIYELGEQGMGLEGVDPLRTTFLLGGCVRIITEWVRGRIDASPQELADAAIGFIEMVRDDQPST